MLNLFETSHKKRSRTKLKDGGKKKNSVKTEFFFCEILKQV